MFNIISSTSPTTGLLIRDISRYSAENEISPEVRSGNMKVIHLSFQKFARLLFLALSNALFDKDSVCENAIRCCIVACVMIIKIMGKKKKKLFYLLPSPLAPSPPPPLLLPLSARPRHGSVFPRAYVVFSTPSSPTLAASSASTSASSFADCLDLF